MKINKNKKVRPFRDTAKRKKVKKKKKLKKKKYCIDFFPCFLCKKNFSIN